MEYIIFLIELFLGLGTITLLILLVFGILTFRKDYRVPCFVFKLMTLLDFVLLGLVLLSLQSSVPDARGLLIADICLVVSLVVSLFTNKKPISSLLGILSSVAACLALYQTLLSLLDFGAVTTYLSFFSGFKIISWLSLAFWAIAAFFTLSSFRLLRLESFSKQYFTLMVVTPVIFLLVGFGHDIYLYQSQIKKSLSSEVKGSFVIPFLRDGNLWLATVKDGHADSKEFVKATPGFQIAEFKISPDQKYLALDSYYGSFQNGTKYSQIEIYDLANKNKVSKISGADSHNLSKIEWSSDDKIAYLDSNKDDTIFISDTSGKFLSQYSSSKLPVYAWVDQDLLFLKSKNIWPDSTGYGQTKVYLAQNGIDQPKEFANLDLPGVRLPVLFANQGNSSLVVKSFPDWETPMPDGAVASSPIYSINIKSGSISTVNFSDSSSSIGVVSPDLLHYTLCPDFNACYMVDPAKTTKVIFSPRPKFGYWIDNKTVLVKDTTGVKIYDISGAQLSITNNPNDMILRYDF